VKGLLPEAATLVSFLAVLSLPSCSPERARQPKRTEILIMHLGLVSDGTGGYRGQMAVLEKPNGLFGKSYMAGVGPFRHLIVYPALTRQWKRAWRERVDRIGTENGEPK
jgi:hypothetical protein